MATESTESTDSRSPAPEVVLPPLPRKGVGVKGKKFFGGLGWGPWIPWIPWLIRGEVEGSRIVPSITPEIPGKNLS